jgi:general secretion pathway protein C
MTATPKWSDFVSRDSGRTIAAANSLLPAWVSLIIVILIGWQLAKIIWMFVPGNAAGDRVDIPAGQLQVSANSSATNVQSIAEAQIFGEADPDVPADVPPPIDDGPIDETNLRLVLKGTHASTDAALAVAIITDGGTEEIVYRIGDPVASGANLHAVNADHVVLDERGKLTRLDLPREYAQTSAPSVRRQSSAFQTRNSQSIQAVVAQNVSRLADVIRPTPFFVAGKQQGYRVYPGRDRQQFAALGLRPGDLIKQIDGQSLEDPTQAMQIFQSLGTADQVSVTVERNGTQETLTLSTEQLDIGKEQTE